MATQTLNRFCLNYCLFPFGIITPPNTAPPADLSFPGIGEFGNLRVKEAFIAATSNSVKGTFVALKDNGIRCITTPCFSTNKLVLNKPYISQVSSIDLSQTSATQKQLDAAASEIFGQGLIAVGRTEVVGNSDPTKRDTKFVATQFYLKVEPN